jgi:biopolymer transport protein ExbB
VDRERWALGPVVLAACLAIPPASSETTGAATDGTGSSTAASTTEGSSASSATTSSAGGTDSTTTGTDPSSGSTAAIDCPPDWWDCAWRVRQSLAMAPSATQLELIEVPVLVHLDETRFDFERAAADGADVRFVLEDGTVLPHEIEAWSPPKEAFVWLRLPRVGDDPLTVWLYSDNPDAEPLGRETEVWSNGYVAVWHFAGDLLDSTANAVHCAPTTELGSEIGRFGLALGLGDGFGLCDDTDALDGLFQGGGTIDAWIHPTEVTSDSGRIVDKASSTTPGGYNLAARTDESVHFARGHSLNLGMWRTDGGSVPRNAWTRVTVTYAEGDLPPIVTLYVDGVNADADETSAPLGSPDEEEGLPLAIGNIAGSQNRQFIGLVDEIRLSRVIRSPEWIAFQMASARDEVFQYGEPELR